MAATFRDESGIQQCVYIEAVRFTSDQQDTPLPAEGSHRLPPAHSPSSASLSSQSPYLLHQIEGLFRIAERSGFRSKPLESATEEVFLLGRLGMTAGKSDRQDERAVDVLVGVVYVEKGEGRDCGCYRVGNFGNWSLASFRAMGGHTYPSETVH